MNKERTIKFEVMARRWFDKINGNTYFSTCIKRLKDGKVIYCPYQYGYGDQYKQTSLDAMLDAGFLPKQYNKDNVNLYEYENNYPVLWIVKDGLKRDCISNGKQF